MKKRSVTFLVSALAIMTICAGAWAGALDRRAPQQRYNQAADEMIRVPGVIGMWEQDALAVLQQSGVVPSIEYEKKFKKDLAGKEGTVIEQVPGAAGITMLGSTVSITVYWPASMGPEPGTDDRNETGAGQVDGSSGVAQPPSGQVPAAPQWGSGDQPATTTQPAGGGGWTPPPTAPATQPNVSPAAPMSATPAPIAATPVQQTVTPVAEPKPESGSSGDVSVTATPVQPTATQAEQQESKPPPVTMTPVQQMVTPVTETRQEKQPTEGVSVTATPVEPTATRAEEQESSTPTVPMTPVQQTVTPVSGQRSSGPAPIAATPVQPTATQADQQESSTPTVTMTPVQQTVTPVSRQRPSGPAPIAATPVQPTATQSEQQNSAPATFTATPVQQTLTPVTIAPSGGQSSGGSNNSSCAPGSPMVVDIFKKAVVLAKDLGCKFVDAAAWGQCVDDIEKAGKMRQFSTQLTQLWGHLVKNSGLTIGPRKLMFGTNHNGTIVGSTGRMFITPVPINGENINIRLTKKAGKSRTYVTVCSYLPDGIQNSEWQFESPGGNKNKGQVWTKSLANMQGKILSIHLDGKSVANTFQYSVISEKN